MFVCVVLFVWFLFYLFLLFVWFLFALFVCLSDILFFLDFVRDVVEVGCASVFRLILYNGENLKRKIMSVSHILSSEPYRVVCSSVYLFI
jgi:hypothetical protein